MTNFEKFDFIDFYKAVVANGDKAFRLSKEKLYDLRYTIISERFIHHYENNPFYRDFCKENNFSPEDIKEYDGMKRIPAIPATLFKQRDADKVLNINPDDKGVTITSTGTDGLPSVSTKDSNSLERSVLSVRTQLREHFRINKGVGIYLSPSLIEFPRMGMVRTFNLLKAALYESHELVRDFIFDPKEAVDILEDKMETDPCYILGPPFLVIRLLNYLKENNINLKLNKESLIITLGGWKRFSGDAIPREKFEDMCIEYLGMEKNQVRDMYGTAESSILAMEDQYNNLLVPPWAYFSIRKKDNVAREAEPGEVGIVAIYDTTIENYPGFLLTADLGLAQDGQWGDRYAQKFVFKGRSSTATHGSCALNMDKYMKDKEESKDFNYKEYAESKV